MFIPNSLSTIRYKLPINLSQRRFHSGESRVQQLQ